MNPKRIQQALIGLVYLAQMWKIATSQNESTCRGNITRKHSSRLSEENGNAQGFTQTPSPVPTLTFTRKPKISLNGTSLMMNDDGSALFVDHKAGIQLTIPAGWMALRVNEKEYYDAFTAPVVVANLALSERLT